MSDAAPPPAEPAPPARRRPPAGRPLRAAVIGVGHFGPIHARIYDELPDVELVAVVDTNTERLGEVAQRHGCVGLSSIDELIELSGRDPSSGWGAGPIDVVSVAVPTIGHHAVATRLFDAGMHLLVEKPLAQTTAEGRELCAMAAARGLTLQVGHVERFNPALRAAFDLVRDPRYIVGDRLSPFPFRSTDIGVVMDLMIHDLDIILALVDGDVARLDAVGVPVLSSRQSMSEDIANARIVFENGCVANLSASRVSVKRMRKLRLFQGDGYVSIDFGEKRVQVIRRSPEVAAEQVDLEGLAKLPAEQRMAVLFGKLLQVQEFSMDDEEEPLRVEIRSFCDAVRSGGTPEVTGEDGVRAIELAERIRDQILTYLEGEIDRAGGPPSP